MSRKTVSDLGPEDALQGHAGRIDHRHVETALAGGGSHLAADPTGADDHDRTAPVQPFAQGVGAVDAAQVEDPGPVAAWHREPSRPCSGRQQQAVVGHSLPVVELDLLLGGQQAHRAAAEVQFDVVLRVEVTVVHVRGLPAGLTAQVLLGQRRPLVGALVLGADQQDAPFEAIAAQRLGGLGAGQAGADDDVGLVSGHEGSLW